MTWVRIVPSKVWSARARYDRQNVPPLQKRPAVPPVRAFSVRAVLASLALHLVGARKPVGNFARRAGSLQRPLTLNWRT